jgi:hypothetical protein
MQSDWGRHPFIAEEFEKFASRTVGTYNNKVVVIATVVGWLS